MKKIIKSNPAKYPDTSPAEISAVKILEAILDHTLVKPDIKILDKVPNYDGSIELTEPDQTPIGKLDVQVRKLPDEYSDDPKYQCGIEFLSFCENNILPTLLICVDIDKNVAYWQLIEKILLKSLNLKEGQQTKCINLPKDNIIKRGDNRYYLQWKQIVVDHYKQVSTLREESEMYKQAYERLADNSEATLGLEDERFGEIHSFLDCLNGELDNAFRIVKEIFFPGSWKLGLAFMRYKKSDISYYLYPIPLIKNDVQIKQIGKESISKLKEFQNLWSINYANNPVSERPLEYAYENIYRKLQDIIRHKGFPFNHPILTREVVFYFTDELITILGIKRSDKYKISDLRYGIDEYFPVWCDEILKNDKPGVSKKERVVNLGTVLPQMSPSEIKSTDIIVCNRLVRKEGGTKKFYIGEDFCFFNLFTEALNYLEKNNIHTVDRIFIPRNYDRVKGGKNAFIWSFWSRDEVKQNIRRLFSEFVEVYDSFISLCFPKIKDDLCYFNMFDRVVICVSKVKESYDNAMESPLIDYYYLKNIKRREQIIDIYFECDKEMPDVKAIGFGQVLAIGEDNYKVYQKSWERLDFIFRGLPMTEFIYKVLEDRLKSYFNERGVR